MATCETPGVRLVVCILVVASLVSAAMCMVSVAISPHEDSVILGEDIVVNIEGIFQYDQQGRVAVMENGALATRDHTAFLPNQFYGYRQEGRHFQGPSFSIFNRGKIGREIHIKTLSGWIVPFSGKTFLWPGDSFQFSFQPVKGSKYWFCWINVEE